MKLKERVEKLAVKVSQGVGSTESLIGHLLFFTIPFGICFFGTPFESVLLFMTTLVSFEAILLSILIQMSINMQTMKLHTVAENVVEIQEDVEEIQQDVEEIQKDVEEIQEEDDENEALTNIETTLKRLIKEITSLKNKKSPQ